jgi:hypothetical protein
LIKEPIEREHHLVPILVVSLPRLTEFDQPIDKRIGQVEGNSTRSSRRRRDRDTRRSPAGTVVDTAARGHRSTTRFQPTLAPSDGLR